MDRERGSDTKKIDLKKQMVICRSKENPTMVEEIHGMIGTEEVKYEAHHASCYQVEVIPDWQESEV